MATFLGELEDHVRNLNRDLLALERSPSEARAPLLRTIFRTAHSLKGAARSVNVEPIEAACHQLETLLGAAGEGSLANNGEVLQLLFAAADALADAGRRLRERQPLTDSPLTGLLPRLAAAAPPPAAPSSPSWLAPASEVPPRAGRDGGALRVPIARLDALLASSGELLVARRRIAARLQEVDGLREAAVTLRREWQRRRPRRRPPAGDGARADAPPRGGDDDTALRRDLERLEQGLERLGTGLEADQRQLDRVAAPLEAEVRQLRMLPLAEACQGLERLVRDLARAGGKEVELTLGGTDVELDRAILDGLTDPLLQLVRNAVDHGIEPPEQREAAGKPRRGLVAITARLIGGSVEVAVSDDGRGLDLEALVEQARRSGLPLPADESERARLALLPGLSTAPRVTELSGRGMGLDVVRGRVEALHGAIEVATSPGTGARFVLVLPLTLSLLRVLLVGVQDQVFAVPASAVRRLLRVVPGELATVEGRTVLPLPPAPVSVVSLAATLGFAVEPAPAAGASTLVLLAGGERTAALVVDRALAEQEVVIKPLGAELDEVRWVSGATLLPSGQVALILSPGELIDRALALPADRQQPSGHGVLSAPTRRRLLVVDDSLTTRSLVKSILVAAGYEVLTAADGAAAWRLLQQHGADLLVADVEMPGLDGFELTAAVRASPRFRRLPVVLVTALESEPHRRRGLEVGADAYLAKSAFDQSTLLAAIERLL